MDVLGSFQVCEFYICIRRQVHGGSRHPIELPGLTVTVISCLRKHTTIYHYFVCVKRKWVLNRDHMKPNEVLAKNTNSNPLVICNVYWYWEMLIWLYNIMMWYSSFPCWCFVIIYYTVCAMTWQAVQDMSDYIFDWVFEMLRTDQHSSTYKAIGFML